MGIELLKRLDRIFYPRSVAVIGAGVDPTKVGHAVMDSLVTGKFEGRIYPIHTRHEKIFGYPVFKDVEDLPEIPDLAVVALNQSSSVQMVKKLREIGVSGAVVLAGGYAEMGDYGRELQENLREAAGLMPVIGPNTLGLINTHAKLNVTFYPRELVTGNVSFLSQSGGIGLAIKSLAHDQGLKFSKWIGVGNRVNLEFHHLLDYLNHDDHTKVIGIFTEGSGNPRAMIETMKRVSLKKPIIIYKAGQGKFADKVTVTHTGAAAGSSRVWEGALRQSGVEVANSVNELVAMCKAFSFGIVPKGPNIAIFTHTAGPSIVAWDILQQEPYCELATLGDESLQSIAQILGPSVPVVYKNPVDGAAGAFLTKPFHDIAEVILKDKNVDSMLAIFCEHKNWQYPTQALVELRNHFNKTVVACFIGSIEHIEPARSILHEAGIPTYCTPEDAAFGLKSLIRKTKQTFFQSET
ncbi:MAG: CoA-binding protein [Deltaproteobacteria bacterium]|nr:CoA-binding protein [Deltaproteobacteria bacterium]